MENAIDWGKAASEGTQIYPEGTYEVKITGWKYVTAGTGTEQVRWFADIVQPEEFKDKSIVCHTPLTDKALFKIANLVASCGADLQKLGKMELKSFDFENVLNACIGQRSAWYVIKNEYNGKVNNKVQQFAMPENQKPIEPKQQEDVSPYSQGE